jgi:AraC-like DNA-binding protein
VAQPGLEFWIVHAGEFHAKPNYLAGSFEYADHTQVYYHLEGEAFFDNEDGQIALTPGDLVVIPPGFYFAYHGRRPVKHHWFAIKGVWPEVFGPPGIKSWRLPHDPEIDEVFVQLRETLILGKPGHPLRAISLFYELLGRIEELSGTAAPESAYPEPVRNAMVFLRENYSAPFSAAKTAGAVGLSESYMRALFEKWLGESPKRFHTRCRIEQAKRLLREQHLAVAEVAFHIGFTDVAHFSRIFKQIVGVAPRYYAQGDP